MYGITARAASQVWLGMGGQGIGAREVLHSIFLEGGATTPFWGVSFK